MPLMRTVYLNPNNTESRGSLCYHAISLEQAFDVSKQNLTAMFNSDVKIYQIFETKLDNTESIVWESLDCPDDIRKL